MQYNQYNNGVGNGGTSPKKLNFNTKFKQ